MGGFGARLRTIRRQWQLSLREVEKLSLCLLSPAPSRRWRYRTEIESIGRVVMVAVPLVT